MTGSDRPPPPQKRVGGGGGPFPCRWGGGGNRVSPPFSKGDGGGGSDGKQLVKIVTSSGRGQGGEGCFSAAKQCRGLGVRQGRCWEV